MTLLQMAHTIQAGCERTLGYLPQLSTPGITGAAPVPMEFRIDKLRATGFTLEDTKNAMDAEVSATLTLCRDQGAGTP
jgi:hypothetical protein